MVPGSAGHVLGNVGIFEKSAAGFEVDKSIANISFSFAKGFYFGPMQHQASFQLLKNMIIVGSGAILRDNLFTRFLRVFAPVGTIG